MEKEKLMSYKEMIAPDEVTYVSHHGSLQYPVEYKDEQGNIVSKTYQWKEGRLILSKTADKVIIEALDEHWVDQWMRDKDGNIIIAPDGIRVRKPNKTEVPYQKFDEFEASIMRTPINLEIKQPFGKSKILNVSPDYIAKLVAEDEKRQKSKTKEKENANE